MKNKGITLIALVITIIVLLILAGITISLTIGNQGVITRAQQASKNYKDAEEKEQEELDNFDTEVDDIIEGKTTKRIGTLEEFTEFRDNVNSGETFEGITIKLTKDIDLSSIENWQPIGAGGKIFKGTFDGGNHTINNLSIVGTGDNTGLFGHNEGNIQNLKLQNIDINVSGNNVGGLVGYNGIGNIQNVQVAGKIIAKNCLGGIVGNTSKGNITNCINNVSITGVSTVGGIVGTNNNTIIEDCINKGNNSSVNEVGGIAGALHDNGKIANCYNEGNIEYRGTAEGSKYPGCDFGGICGSTFSGDKGSIEKCMNSGNVTSPSSTGGILGLIRHGSVKSCVNTGTITGRAGGIVGETQDSTGATVDSCYNTGNIICDKNSSGGVFGHIRPGTQDITISNCYNRGNISITTSNSNGKVGGVLGLINEEGVVTLNNNYWLSTCGASSGVAEKTNEDPKEVSSKSEEEFFSLADDLGTEYAPDTEEEKINNGYPILKWQVKK